MAKEFNIEKLKGAENYHTWVFEVQNVLRLKKLGKYISEDGDENDDKREECRAILSLTVEKSLFPLIRKFETAKEIWTALKNRFEDKGLSRKIGLLRFLISIRLDGNMGEYLSSIMDTANKLSDVDFPISDDWLVAIILAGLGDEFKPFIMGLEAAGQELTPDEISSKLLDNDSMEDAPNTALMSRKGGQKKKNVKCFNCGKRGHTKAECRAEKIEKSKGTGGGAKLAFLSVMEKTNKESAVTALLSKGHGGCTEWYVDSGATTHMTPMEQVLKTKRGASVEKITCANGDGLTVKNIGSSKFTVNGREVDLPDVLHVPGLAANLLSVSRIVENGNTVMFSKDGCIIRDKNNEKITECKANHGVYKINMNFAATAVKRQKHNAYEWHRMLGHSNAEYVKRFLKRYDFVTDTTSLNKIKNCVTCAEGKHSRPPFEKSISHTSEILELVHSDVMGPMETKTVSGARFILTFVDDFSGMVFVRFLKEKSEVFNSFTQFIKLVENQTGRKIKKLRSDNGTEYTSNKMMSFMQENGILHQKTAPYTPQQNGKAERMNRTLVEKAKCLLFDADLPKRFWAEAVNMAAFLVNNTFMDKNDKTPNEIFYGKEVDMSDLKFFGSKVMAQIPKVKRRKWDKNSRELIFVGYDAESKAYRCVEKTTGQLTISRDVIFLDKDSNVEVEESENVVKLEMTTDDEDQELINRMEASASDAKPTHEGDVADHDTNDVESSDGDRGKADADEKLFGEGDRDEAVEDDTAVDDPDYAPERNFETPEPQPRVTRAATKANVRFNPFGFNFYAFITEPVSPKSALSSPEAADWKKAMDEEIQAHTENNTWQLAELPSDRKAIKAKWVFKLKKDENGKIIRYKARLVAKGYSQIYGIDYDETYSPVVRYTSLRMLMAVAARDDLKIYQMDAITAFLQGDLDVKLYMEQPEGYEDGSKKICRLNKAIYGLKQAGREWNLKLDAALKVFGLRRSQLDPCIYFGKDNTLILAIYVDDILIFFKDQSKLDEMKRHLKANFKIKDIGLAKGCIGMRIHQDKGVIELDQTTYITEMLEKFGMGECKPVGTPADTSVKLLAKDWTEQNSLVGKVPYQEVVGSLLYLAQTTRPDICFAVNNVSRFNERHTEVHWIATKRILRYLQGTKELRLRFTATGGSSLAAYSDADWASDSEDRRSCTGYVTVMSGGAISWSSKRQPTVALSSTEAEYMALSATLCEVLWLKQLMNELNCRQRVVKIWCDNTSTIRLTETEAYRPRTKHIDIRFHRIREHVENGDIEVKFMPTKQMVADSLTKSVSKETAQFCAKMMGLALICKQKQ